MHAFMPEPAVTSFFFTSNHMHVYHDNDDDDDDDKKKSEKERKEQLHVNCRDYLILSFIPNYCNFAKRCNVMRCVAYSFSMRKLCV